MWVPLSASPEAFSRGAGSSGVASTGTNGNLSQNARYEMSVVLVAN